jgi:hypothetical protein
LFLMGVSGGVHYVGKVFKGIAFVFNRFWWCGP